MAFAPNGQGGTYFNDWSAGLSGTGAGCFNAGIDLPAGSKNVPTLGAKAAHRCCWAARAEALVATRLSG